MQEGWNEIYMTATSYKAEMAKDIIENAGIKAVLLNQQDSAYQTFGEFRIFVAKEDTDKATKLIKEFKRE